MGWKPWSLLIGVTLCGCAVVPPFQSDSLEMTSAEAGGNRSRIAPAEVGALHPGSKVEIENLGLADTLTGTVLQARPEGLVLINCVYVNRSANRQVLSTRRLPCHWVSIRRIVNVKTIAPAPEGFVPPSLEIDTNDSEEFPGGPRQGVEFL